MLFHIVVAPAKARAEVAQLRAVASRRNVERFGLRTHRKRSACGRAPLQAIFAFVPQNLIDVHAQVAPADASSGQAPRSDLTDYEFVLAAPAPGETRHREFMGLLSLTHPNATRSLGSHTDRPRSWSTLCSHEPGRLRPERVGVGWGAPSGHRQHASPQEGRPWNF